MAQDTKQEKKNQEEEEEEEVSISINGDILESIFTHVPLIDLVPTIQVSKTWNKAVSTSLAIFNKIKPWLILHTQSTRPPYSITSHAYDPRSSLWIKIHQPLMTHNISTLRSSHSKLLYLLSPSKFSFSFDPLHLTWHQVDAPLVWRTDPIVAVVGHRVIVAGGTCDFEDDPLAVEMYDMNTSTWDTCESMPAIFKDSAASMWLSVAVNRNKMYLVEKKTGVAYWFHPETKSWHGPYNLSPNKNLISCCIGFANDRLILIGIIGDDNEAVINSVKLWELNGESPELCKEIGEMPEFLVEKLGGKNEALSLSSVVVNLMGELVYIVSNSAPEEVFICELHGGDMCRWSSVPNVVVNDDCRLTKRLVFTCNNVGLGNLRKAIFAGGRQFTLI